MLAIMFERGRKTDRPLFVLASVHLPTSLAVRQGAPLARVTVLTKHKELWFAAGCHLVRADGLVFLTAATPLVVG